MNSICDMIAQLRHGSDKDILGDLLQPCDRNADYLQSNECYAWYVAFGDYWKPKSILELGVRFGYSLKSLIVGALKHHPPQEITVHGFDNEQEDGNCLLVVDSMLSQFQLKEYYLHKVNLRETESFGVENVDLVHLDCDHRFGATYEDLHKSWAAVRDGGVILVDDISDINVKAATDVWCQEKAVTPTYLATFRGLYIIEKKC